MRAVRKAWAWTLVFAIGMGAAAAAEWTKEEQEALLAAIEDYNFGDLEDAIAALSALAKRHPKDARVLRYLALSLSEAGKHTEASRIFAQWKKLVGARFAEDRDALLAYARSLRAADRPKEAAQVLQAWLARKPQDLEARMELGTALVQAGKLKQAQTLWQGLWRQAQAPGLRAAAAYYLAWIAAQRGENEAATRWANKALALDKEGPYGQSAKLLLRTLQGEQGFHGELALGVARTSNVDLLPDIARPQKGKPRSDVFGDARVQLRYQGAHVLAEYVLEAQKYNKRSDYDLIMHIARAGWRTGPWEVAPVLEYVMLARQRLFWGVGLDLNWKRADWDAGYSLRARTFTSAFGPQRVDLRRLGGLVHELHLARSFGAEDQRVTLGVRAHLEQTKGDATHPKTDDFAQVALELGYARTSGAWDASVQLTGWLRSYRRRDLIAGKRRQDRFVFLGGELGRAFGEGARHRVALRVHWQRNDSNFKPPAVPAALDKTFTEWAAGAEWSWRW